MVEDADVGDQVKKFSRALGQLWSVVEVSLLYTPQAMFHGGLWGALWKAPFERVSENLEDLLNMADDDVAISGGSDMSETGSDSDVPQVPLGAAAALGAAVGVALDAASSSQPSQPPTPQSPASPVAAAPKQPKTKKRRRGLPVNMMTPPRPLSEAETPVAAAIRAQLRVMLGDGPLTPKRAEKMHQFVEKSFPVIQLMKTNFNDSRAPGTLMRVQAASPTPFGLMSLSSFFMSSTSVSDGIKRVALLGAFVARRAVDKAQVIGADLLTRILDDDSAKAQPEVGAVLAARLARMLEQPYTIAMARRIDDVLTGALPLLKALAPAQDYLSGSQPPQPGPQITNAGVSYINASTFQMSSNPGSIMNDFMPVTSGSYGVAESLPEGENEGYDAPLPEGADDDEDEDEDEPSAPVQPLVTSSANETFGARMIREIIGAIPVLANAQRNTPENMVLAIVAAERAGMPQLARRLRKSIGLPEENEVPNPPMPFAFPTPGAPTLAQTLAQGNATQSSAPEVPTPINGEPVRCCVCNLAQGEKTTVRGEEKTRSQGREGRHAVLLRTALRGDRRQAQEVSSVAVVVHLRRRGLPSRLHRIRGARALRSASQGGTRSRTRPVRPPCGRLRVAMHVHGAPHGEGLARPRTQLLRRALRPRHLTGRDHRDADQGFWPLPRRRLRRLRAWRRCGARSERTWAARRR
jgi:hypothetical protein